MLAAFNLQHGFSKYDEMQDWHQGSFALLDVLYFLIAWDCTAILVFKMLHSFDLSGEYIFQTLTVVDGLMGFGQTETEIEIVRNVTNLRISIGTFQAPPNEISKSILCICSGTLFQCHCSHDLTQLILCQPSFCGVLLTMYQWCYSTFLLLHQCPTHQACWLLAFCCNASLPACPILSHHVRTVQTHAGWWWPPVLSRNRHHAPTQTIPICGLMGCQDHYCSPGLA